MSEVWRRLASRWILPFVDPRRLYSLIRLPRFFAEWRAYRQRSGERVAAADLYPCLTDRTAQTPFDPHYFHQGAWIARKLAKNRPAAHVDIASSVLTVSVFSAFVPTTFVDFRPLPVNLSNLETRAGDIAHLPFADGELQSLSCLHVIEHIGLGRYGDPLDPDGLRKAAAELKRVVAPHGRLYLSTPIGRERVYFNAHRVSSPSGLMALFEGFDLASFALVDDQGAFRPDAKPADGESLDYGCGLFEFVKL
jgi:SAM-dependent methyltransferase